MMVIWPFAINKNTGTISRFYSKLKDLVKREILAIAIVIVEAIDGLKFPFFIVFLFLSHLSPVHVLAFSFAPFHFLAKLLASFNFGFVSRLFVFTFHSTSA